MNQLTYTIGIPVYDRILGFSEALSSALSVVECTEIIVVDDHSAHNDFKEICETFDDSRIRYVKNENNIGLFGNWNRCIQLANSDFISILCSDDLIEGNAFKLFLEAYTKDNTIDVFFGSFTTFEKAKNDAKVQRTFKEGPMSGFQLLSNAILNGLGFPVLSIMRTSTMRKWPYVSKPHSGNDWLWIYSNATRLNLYATGQTINYWRRHVDQDAIKNQDITRDCWPLMYFNMSKQLKKQNRILAWRAERRAKGVIMSTLINEYRKDRTLEKRLHHSNIANDIFLEAILDIVNHNWILKKLLYSNHKDPYFNLARLVRKLGYYPGEFS